MKKWLKRGLTALLCSLLCLTGALGFVACDKGDGTSASNSGSVSGSDDTSNSSSGNHTHDYTETIVVDATCMAEGQKKLTCECGDVKTESIPMIPHTEVVDAAVAATCMSTGLTEGKHCSVCGTKTVEQTVTSKLAHDFTKADTADKYLASEATCTAQATYYYSCTVCGAADTNTFASGSVKAHAWMEKADSQYLLSAATCTTYAIYNKSCEYCGEKGTETFEGGSMSAHVFEKQDTDSKYLATAAACEKNATYYYSCTACDKKGTTTFEKAGSALNHVFEEQDTDSKYLATAATCEKNATYYYSCTACGEKGTTTFEKAGSAGHNYTSELVKPTCLQEGYYVYTCSGCGKTYSDMEKLQPALGHDYTAVETAATCTAQGYTTYTCSCGDSYVGNYTDFADHTYEYVETIPSTCAEKGYDLHKCKNCTETKKDNYQELAEHTYTTETTKEATCTEEGIKTIVYTCACAKTVEEKISKTNHTYVAGTPVAPTCTEVGYTVYTCDGCGDSYTADEVNATGHQSYSAEQTQAPTCTQKGVMTYTCDGCGDSYTEEIDETGHDCEVERTVEPTCTEEGYTIYSCKNDNCDYTYNDNFEAASGHSHTVVDTKVSTCTEKGYTVYRCACGNEYTTETDAHGHTIDNSAWAVVTDDEGNEVLTQISGCTYERTYTQVCGECGEPLEKKEELTKHNYSVAITKTATCQGGGTKTFTCTVEGCGNSYDESYTVKEEEGHKWSTPQTTGGVETVTCTVEGCEATKTTIKAEEGATDATIDKSALSQTGEIQMDAATIKMDETTKSQLTDGEGDLDIHASTLNETDKNAAINNVTDAALREKLQDQEIFNFTVSADGTTISRFNGKMTVTVPYNLNGQDAEGIAVYFLNDNGEIEEIPAIYSEINGQGYATFETDHFSKYTVVRLTPSERCALYGHDWKERTVNATCTLDGYHLKYCIRCGSNETIEVYTALGHNYAASVTPATCTTQGYTTYACQNANCQASYVGDFEEATGHDYVATVVDPTCTESGYTTYTCQNENCGTSYNSNIVAALGHDFVTETKDPTCEEKGYTTYTCEECGYSYVSDYTPATGHNYQEDGVEESTCTAPGHTKFKCHCGKNYNGKYTPAKGHKYNKGNKHDATCQQGGYTEYKCEHCDDSYEADFTPTTKHDYDANGVKHDATCFEKGYTRHNCKHCDAYYDDDFKDKKKHEYEATVFAPTCTEKGYTLYTCKHHGQCKDSYKSDYVPALGHVWGADYICTRENCGAEHPALSHGSQQFYITLRDSIANAASYFVTVEDLVIDQTYASNDVVNNNYRGDVEIVKLTFAYDENGYVVGHGEFRMPVIQTEYDEGEISSTRTETYLLKIIFAQGKAYIFTGDIREDNAYETYMMMSQEMLETYINFPFLQLKAMYVQCYSDNARQLLTAALGLTDKDVNAALGAITEFIFVKSQTGENYTFTIDADQLYSVAEKISQQSAQELFDTFFGKGALERLFDWANETLDKTVGELEADIEENLVEAGYTLDDLYNFVNETAKIIVGAQASKFDLRQIVDSVRNEVVGEMIVEAMGGGNHAGGVVVDSTLTTMTATNDRNGMTVEDLKAMLTEIENMCADNNIVSVILQMSGEAAGKEEADEYIERLLEELKTLCDYIGETEITISTDKTGKASAINLKIDLKIENRYGYGDGSYSLNTIVITGNGKIKFNESYEMDFVDLKDTIEDLFDAIDLKDGNKIENYVVYKNGDKTLIAYDISYFMNNEPTYMEGLGVEEIDGVSYYKYKVMWSDWIQVELPNGEYTHVWGNGFYFADEYGFRTDDSCGDWMCYDIIGHGCNVYYTIWINPETQSIRSEIDWGMTENSLYSYTNAFRFWYNESTGEYTTSEVHNYQVVDEYLAEECEEESWQKYECLKCGDTYTSYWNKGHNTEYKYELCEGATSCEDGVVEIIYCLDCDYEYVYHEIQRGHYWNRETIYIDTDCGKVGIEIDTCACGYDRDTWLNLNGECNFREDTNKKEEDSTEIVRTYICDDCGKVIVLSIGSANNGCYQTGYYKVTVDGEAIVEKNYSLPRHESTTYTEETVDGITTRTETCACGKIASVKKFDAWGRIIYSVNENGFGYAHEYDGCEYIYYYITPAGKSVRAWGREHAQSENPVYVMMDGSATCLDGVIAEWYCDCCGELLNSESVYSAEHSFNVCVETIETPCGSITVTYGVCPCGEEKRIVDVPISDGCKLIEIKNELGSLDIVCETCGLKIYGTAETASEGCVNTVNFTVNVYMDGDVNGVAAWTLAGKYSYTTHQMDGTYELDENGNRMVTYGCVNCSYFEMKRTYDQYDRELRYERANGSGYYYVYNEDCTYTRYGFDRNGEWYTGGGQRHSWKERREFIGEENCAAGVRVGHYCEACGQKEEYYDEYYYHQSFYQEVYSTVTECGRISARRYGCLCGYGYYDKGLQWSYNACEFTVSYEQLEDTETEFQRYKETHICSNCGFTYTVYSYVTKEACTTNYYTVYSFGVTEEGCDVTHTVYRKEISHTAERVEEGANDQGVYVYERYCADCNTWLEHYESDWDDNGRQIYYMDRLNGYGWERVYSTEDCSYVEYALDQLGNRGESFTGMNHANIRTRCELFEGVTNCEEGIHVIHYCSACEMITEEYDADWHYSYRHIEEFNTDCGVVKLEYDSCACGQDGWNYADIFGSCNIEWANIEWFEATEEDPRYNHNIESYKCAITDCGFSYTAEYYYTFLTADSCLATHVKTYTLYEGEDVIYTKTFTWENHEAQLQYFEETDENGNVIFVRGCKYCDWVEKRDRFDRIVYHWNPYSDWGYRNTYTGCECYHEEFNSAGVYNSYYYTEHMWAWRDIQQACTQYGTAIEYCRVCGIQQDYNYVAPGHAYVWNEELGLYVCDRCGLKNEKNVDGDFIVEDLTYQYGQYTAGVFNKLGNGWQMQEGYNFYIMLNYTVDENGAVSGVNVTDKVTFDVFEYGYENEPEGSGLITLDNDSLWTAIKEVYGENAEGFEHVSIVFQVFDKYEEVNGEHYYSYVDHVLTFGV